MFKDFRAQARRMLSSALAERGVDVEPELTIPGVERFGDLSTNICFQIARAAGRSPGELALELSAKMAPEGLVREVKAENGYINFYLDYRALAEGLFKKVGAGYGRGYGKGKVIVEHTSANPDGPLHIGHLRNAVIGDCLARLLRFAGYDVEVHYYVNDMGRQAGLVVLGLRRIRLGEGKKDHRIGEVYVKVSREFESGEHGRELAEALSLYENGAQSVVEEFETAVKTCLEGITETLSRLGIAHDRFVWESGFVRNGSVKRLLSQLAGRGEVRREGGALILDLSKQGVEKELVLTRDDGTTLYIARDLAHHIWKLGSGRCINVWGADHKLVAEQLSAVLELLGYSKPEFIIHEFISLEEGGMSTRAGVFVTADEVVERTVEKAYEEVRRRRPDMSEEEWRSIAEQVGVSAVRFNIARVAPEKPMVFSWDEALDFERQGAPFIQYAYARGRKILEKAGERRPRSQPERMEDSERRLLKLLSRFPEVVEEAARARRVSMLASYAVELAGSFHSFYMSLPVLGSEEESFRLGLVQAFISVLGNAMDILGIRRLDEM